MKYNGGMIKATSFRLSGDTLYLLAKLARTNDTSQSMILRTLIETAAEKPDLFFTGLRLSAFRRCENCEHASADHSPNGARPCGRKVCNCQAFVEPNEE